MIRNLWDWWNGKGTREEAGKETFMYWLLAGLNKISPLPLSSNGISLK